MQLFMPFYFWTLHLIWRLIYSQQRQNLQDCNKPGAHSWHKRSHWHTVRSPPHHAGHSCTLGHTWTMSPAAALGHPRYPPPLPPRERTRSVFHPTQLLQKALNSLPVTSPTTLKPYWETGIIHPVARAPVCCLVMWEVPANGTFHGLFNVSW